MAGVPKETILYPRTNKITVSPEQYINGISIYSAQTIGKTLYPGALFEDLSDFFQPHSTQALPVKRKIKDSPAFAVSYTLGGSKNHKMDEFHELESCLQKATENIRKSQAQVLFLRGYPSPTWIASFGVLFRVDPEFFKWQLRFRSRREYFASPALPSTFKNIITLRFITIGSREVKKAKSNQETVDRLRAEGRRAFQRYKNDLMLNNGIKEGDSIIRRFSVLDERHFIIEQELSMCLNFVGDTWTSR